MEKLSLTTEQREALHKLIDLEYWYGNLIGKHGTEHQFDAEGKRIVKAISAVKTQLGFYE